MRFLTCAQRACYTNVLVRYYLAAAEPRIPARKAAPFVTDQTIRFVLPSHIEAVADAAAAAADFIKNCGVTEEGAFGIEMAVREAVTNAMVHGNQEDETKSVEVIFNCHGNELEVEVKDQGEGFDPASVPNPTDPSNLLKTSGRGIFLMRTFMDQIEWLPRPEGGTTVRMTKHF
jgi:serine/threonine-protein kinase RsbW